MRLDWIALSWLSDQDLWPKKAKKAATKYQSSREILRPKRGLKMAVLIRARMAGLLIS